MQRAPAARFTSHASLTTQSTIRAGVGANRSIEPQLTESTHVRQEAERRLSPHRYDSSTVSSHLSAVHGS
eukprot:6183778-Pleurochrysis_carterae.AAC.2